MLSGKQHKADDVLSIVVTSIFASPDHIKAQVPFTLNCSEMQLHEPFAKC